MNVYQFDEERERRLREESERQRQQRPSQPPAVNLPKIIIWLSVALILIHLVRSFVLPTAWDNILVYYAGFWPAKYLPAVLAQSGPLTLLSNAWSFVTYSLLHGGAMHIIFNLLWMAIFGSAVARRFGAGRFLVFSAFCSVGGALAHIGTHWGEAAPMIGASAAVSGQMAAAIRFVFELGGPLGAFRRSDQAAYYVPAQPLSECFRNQQVLVFVAVWFGLNLFFGLMSGGQGSSIAWQAHIGGFVAGLALFPFFDPVPQRRV
ncbi:rhomboid family intramembrane serine protease [Roseibium denhamense]|uniref:Membrane associated serine protease, rhomboid family n=1 Tax=Roseibium denhamense TaxID=76305 RepID=A0ABY1N5F3_9HYPH|nr:rhomboid family intramembrane serine protease [Roseibium denhamense]MTI04612.1 rhomboid family intramembrane serine protease [Roseibium denhamense]SMP00573.1 Membrane associated serine protease, rhomboid family [Roseibium denhamense]